MSVSIYVLRYVCREKTIGAFGARFLTEDSGRDDRECSPTLGETGM